MDSIGVAVIGGGMAGRAHAAAYRMASTVYGGDLPPIRLVAIADLDEELAADVARRYGYSRSESDWRTIADAPDVDAVSVVVSNALHRDIVETLLSAGKHVLCEKPLADTVENAQAMLAAANRSAHVAAVGFTFRRSPAIAAIAEYVAKGGIGRPIHASARYWCDYAVSSAAPMSWRFSGPIGSGALADLGSHLIDALEQALGDITAVRGAFCSTVITERRLPQGRVRGHEFAVLSNETARVENEDVAHFTALFGSQTSGVFSVSRVAAGLPNTLAFEIFGEEGAVAFDFTRPGEFWITSSTPADPDARWQRVIVGPRHPYVDRGLPMDAAGVHYGQNDLFAWQARAFLEQISGRSTLPPVPDFRTGLHNMHVIDAIAHSAHRAGSEVSVVGI